MRPLGLVQMWIPCENRLILGDNAGTESTVYLHRLNKIAVMELVGGLYGLNAKQH